MDQTSEILEYECPCCGAGLHFSSETQNLKCPYCDNDFDFATVVSYSESMHAPQTDTISWEPIDAKEWDCEESTSLRTFHCPSCGGDLVTDDTTVATFCPYCANPTIVPSRLSNSLKPEAVISV